MKNTHIYTNETNYTEYIRPLARLLKSLNIKLDTRNFLILDEVLSKSQSDKKRLKPRAKEYTKTDKYKYALIGDNGQELKMFLANHFEIALYNTQANFIVLDFDNNQEFNDFISKYNPDTFIIKTNRGGHLYFKTTNKYIRTTPMDKLLDYKKVDLLPCQSGYFRLFYNNQDRYILNDSEVMKLPDYLAEELKPYLKTYQNKANTSPYANENKNNDYNVNLDNLSQIISELAPYLKDCNYNDWFNFSSNLAMLIKDSSGDYDEYMELTNLYDNGKNNQANYKAYWNNLDNRTIKDITYNSTVISNFYNKVLNKKAPPIHTLANKNNELLNHYKNVNYLDSGEYIKISQIDSHMRIVEQNKCYNSLFISSVGTGKTTAFIDYAFKCNKRIMFVVPTTQLVKNLEQIHQDNKKIGFFYGKINSLKNAPKMIVDSYQVIILTIDQTKHLDNKIGDKEQYQIYKPFDICVLDEIHIYASFANIELSKEVIIYDFLYNDKYKKLVNHTISLTATPHNLPLFDCSSSYIRPLHKNVTFLISEEYDHPNSRNRTDANKVKYQMDIIKKAIEVDYIKHKDTTLIFTPHNTLEIDEQIAKELTNLGYSVDVIHSSNSNKSKSITDDSYTIKDFTIASSVLNVGIDFNKHFTNTLVIDNNDINYILQAVNRDRSNRNNVYIFLQSRPKQTPYKLPSLDISNEDITSLKTRLSRYLYINGNEKQVYAMINEYKKIHEHFKDFTKYNISYLDILNIFEYLKIDFNVDYENFKHIKHKTSSKVKEFKELNVSEFRNITDLVSYELVLEHIYTKVGYTNKTDNLLTFKRYNIGDKVKGTTLEPQYKLLNTFINQEVKELRAYHKGESITDEIIKSIDVIYNKPELLEICDIISLKINVYEEVNQDKSISDLVHSKANERLSTDEYKKLTNDIKDNLYTSLDNTKKSEINKSIKNYINSLGYEIKSKKTTQKGKTFKYKILEAKT